MIKVKNDIGFNALCKKSVENANNKSKYKNNDFWQWNMLENLSSSRGNRSSKLDNISWFGSSYTTQKGKLAKQGQMKNKQKKNYIRDKYKNEQRCWSSIASHNANKSLLAGDFDVGLQDKSKIKPNKIHLKNRGKSKKTPNSKQNESKANDSSFQQRTSLNLSQMFNYYANQPIWEKHSRKTSKAQKSGGRSYTSSSVNKKKHPRSKSGYPSINIPFEQNKGRYTATNHGAASKLDRNLAQILDIPMSKFNKFFASKSTSK